MSDQLRRAVQAELEAHDPGPQPPFDAILGRKQRRDRRRMLAAVAASALAVAGVAFVPSALGGGSDGAQSQVAQHAGSDMVFRFHIKATSTQAVIDAGQDGQDAITRCVALPGLSDSAALFSYPGQYTGRVTGQDNADALETCVQAVPGWGITLTPVEEEIEPPSAVQSIAWTGAQVCADPPEGQEECRQLDAAEAVALDAVLDRARPAPVDAVACGAMSTTYRISFQHPSVRPVPVSVPYLCGPMRRGDQFYFLDSEGRQAVKAAFDTGAPATDCVHTDLAATPCGANAQTPLTEAQQAFVQQCVGQENPAPAPGYVGRTEQEANPPDALNPEPPRVVGRDGQCLGRTRDLREGRVNLIVEDGIVIWAGRF